MRNILLHHHLFKNAGSTLDFAFWRNFDERFAHFHDDSLSSKGSVDGPALRDFLRLRPSLVGVTSHHFHSRFFREYDDEEFTGEFAFFHMLLIRNPIDRIVSFYDFYRRGGGVDEASIERARSIGINEWLRYAIDFEINTVNDAQVNILTRYGQYIGPPSQADLELAIARLPAFSLIGTVDNFDDACISAEYYLRPSFGPLDLAYVRENVSARRSSDADDRPGRFAELIDPEIFLRLRALNKLDMALWMAANAELERRITLIPNYAARKTGFEDRKIRLATEIERIRVLERIAHEAGQGFDDYDSIRAPNGARK